MKDVLDTLRQVREKSKHTVDNSSLKELDDAIQALEERIRENSKGWSAFDYLPYVARILAVVKFLHGDSDIH
ncbi:hypothetical protein [Enterobacter hormaechei]|uniref:hypothetical protein n=1 Tax=Enterobacter hormaechei TaxID=158836 RepID=UPI0020765D75|nr:hypothetical protein [Enterobacter hormaechei]MCM8331268.1 hypothetical protein [Enterobacter hormaechei]MCM8344025.1 hypothetical protein [Enterobacter hormaechei]MCM8348674.1 hypothetical protein [Enterobacter hormaechei]MDF3732964.1 hypothetical protein [Enterobacter hormaechei]